MNDPFNFEHLSPEELSPREIQLLQAHLDRETVARWRKTAGPQPGKMAAVWVKYKWPLAAAAACIITLVCWQTGWLASLLPQESNLMATRTEIIDYPFDNIVVRGENVLPGLTRSAKAVAAYNQQDFQTALQEATADDHFFKGVCWLKLQQPEKAITEFEGLGQHIPNDEFYYYQGVALQQTGKTDDAKRAFQQVLNSPTVRPKYKEDARRRMSAGQ